MTRWWNYFLVNFVKLSSQWSDGCYISRWTKCLLLPWIIIKKSNIYSAYGMLWNEPFGTELILFIHCHITFANQCTVILKLRWDSICILNDYSNIKKRLEWGVTLKPPFMCRQETHLISLKRSEEVAHRFFSLNEILPRTIGTHVFNSIPSSSLIIVCWIQKDRPKLP